MTKQRFEEALAAAGPSDDYVLTGDGPEPPTPGVNRANVRPKGEHLSPAGKQFANALWGSRSDTVQLRLVKESLALSARQPW